jgi:HK97 family phage portal protein
MSKPFSKFDKGMSSLIKFHKERHMIETGEKAPISLTRATAANTPILQKPGMAEITTTANMIKSGGAFGAYGNYYDFTTPEYYILKTLARKNKWVAHACHVAASNTVNCEPFFSIASQKVVRDTTKVDFLTKKLLKPNRNETWHTLAYITIYSLFLLGSAYWQVVPTRAGGLHSIYSIPADTMRPVPYIDKETGELRYVYAQLSSENGYSYDIKRVFDDTEIICFKAPNAFSPLYGSSAFSALFDNLELDMSGMSYLNSYMENAYTGGMIFEIKDSSQEVAERTREEIIECLSGAKNAGRNLIVEGEVKLVHDGNKAKDFPLEKIFTKNADEIMETARIPLSVAGIRSANGTINSELILQEEQVFYRNVVQFYQNILFGDIELKFFNNNLNSHDLTIEAGINKNFSTKNAEAKVLTGMKIGSTINELRRINGQAKLEDSNIGEMLVVASNNGILSAETYFSNMEKEAELKNIAIEQANTNLTISKETGTVGKADSAGSSDGGTKIPSVKVSAEKGTSEVK